MQLRPGVRSVQFARSSLFGLLEFRSSRNATHITFSIFGLSVFGLFGSVFCHDHIDQKDEMAAQVYKIWQHDKMIISVISVYNLEHKNVSEHFTCHSFILAAQVYIQNFSTEMAAQCRTVAS